MAHEIPYVATATVADLRDLEYKVERAMEFRGARYLHVFVPCPLGWGSASRDTIRIARLAKETGLFPVFEAEHGEVVGVSKIRRQRAGRGVPQAPAPLRPPVRRPTAARRDRAPPGDRRPQHPRFGLLADGEGADLPGGHDAAGSPESRSRRPARRTPTSCACSSRRTEAA